jgi:hypothetical protein
VKYHGGRHALDRLEQLLSHAPNRRRKNPMTKPVPTPAPLPPPLELDPWPDVGVAPPVSAPRDDVNTAPQDWTKLKPATRAVIGGASIDTLHAHPTRVDPSDLRWLVQRCWDALRATPAVERDLAAHPQIVPMFLLEDVIKKLRSVSSIVAVLDDRITALRIQRDRLAARVGIPSADHNDATAGPPR